MQLLKNVTVKFNHKLILENVNLNSEAKKIAIIGLNGSGKSTILNLLTNEIMPNEGEIYSIKNATYFFQNFSLFSDLTVNENMQLFIHQNWNETLATQLDLHNFKDKKISQCSDGELQRVIICMAILDSSPILILDEPTKHLDEFHKKLVLNLLHHLDKMIIMAIHEENLNLIDGFEIYEIKNKNLSLIHSTLKNYQAISFHHSFSNNIKVIFKNFIFLSKYYIFLFVLCIFCLSNLFIKHFKDTKIDKSILQYDLDLNEVSADLYYQGLPISASKDYQTILINQLKLSANINYTELFLNNQEGFFLNDEKITSIYPIHSNLTLIQGSQITYSSNLIQCYINNTFSKKYNVSIHDKGYLKMLVDNNHINFEYEIIGIVKDTNIFDKFYIDNQQIEMIFTQTIMNTNNETLLQYIQKKSSYFINYHLSFRDFHDYLIYENAIIIIDDNYKLELQLTLYNQYQSKIQNDQKYERFYTFAMYFSMISFIIFLIYFLYDFLHHFYHSLYSLKKLQHSYKQMIIYFILLFAPLFIIQIWLFHYLLFIFIIIDAIIYSYYLFFHKLKI